MSATRWALTLNCDYPECQSVGEALDRDNPPAGWLSLGSLDIRVMDPYGRQLVDYCTLHADVPLSKLAEIMRMRMAENRGPL